MKSHRFIALLALSLAGCGFEKRDKPLAVGKGLGYEWTAASPADVLRVSVENSFTRDATLVAEGGGKHYEVSVGPTRDAFMVIPRGEYEFSGWSYGKSLGNTKLKVETNDRDGIKGVLLRVRP